MIVTFAWPSSGRPGGGVAALYSYADGLARRGHEVHLVHGPRTPDRITDLGQLAWHRFHPDVRHHIVDALDDPALREGDVCFPSSAPRRLGEPAELIQGYKLLAAAFERPAYRARAPKLCVAHWLRDIGVAWGSPPEQMLHVPLGIDHGRFRPPPSGTERDIDVAMLLTPHPVKGGADGLAALAALHEHRPGLRATLFGMTVPEVALPSWAEFRLSPDVAALAGEVYGRAKVFLQPSWREGFGLTSVEAMACGAALVTTDNGGSRDYAVDDETALVVPPRDPSAMARAVAALLDDDRRRTRLATAGTLRARAYDWDGGAAVMEGHLVRYLADPRALQDPPAEAPLFLDDAR